jgi:hypothetical protein
MTNSHEIMQAIERDLAQHERDQIFAPPPDLDRFGVSASDERIVDEMMHKAAEDRAERPLK